MPMSFEMSFEAFNTILLCLAAVVPVVILIATRSDTWGVTTIERMSVRARLPIPSWDMWRSIRGRSRALLRANMWGLLAGIVFVGGLFVWTPAGSSPFAMWLLTLTLLIGVLSIASTIVGVRERLFSPAPAAPRIARAKALQVRDYLPTWAALLPAWLLAAAVLACALLAAMTSVGAIAPLSAIVAVAALAFAGLAAAACRVAEHRVLAQPQPASDTLELAWDDLFRVGAFVSLRMSAAMAAWLPLGLALTGIVYAAIGIGEPDVSRLFSLFPWFGIPFLQVGYSLIDGRLPIRLYPEYLRPAAPAPAPAPIGGFPA
ncbi:hypothetical protein [Microbacterium sp. NPDC058389]|uniref:hypothetical protein n=1 Tax=Microbacterium sp. NPDC058389 TaxID=3346475 RepID=UPI003650688D